jgi:hypothetical protein
VIAVLYVSWLLLTVLANTGLLNRISRYDYLGVIPNWKFFAPTPAVDDYLLFVRYQLDDRSYSNWLEISPKCARTFWHIVWNPEKRTTKALFDIITELTFVVNHVDDPTQVVLSVPYLQLLNYCTGLYPQFDKTIQFMIMTSNYSEGALTYSPYYCSELHRIG